MQIYQNLYNTLNIIWYEKKYEYNMNIQIASIFKFKLFTEKNINLIFLSLVSNIWIINDWLIYVIFIQRVKFKCPTLYFKQKYISKMLLSKL